MAELAEWDVQAVRGRFPALARTQDGLPIAYLDGPAGSQVPQSVVEAVSRCLTCDNANKGAPFPTSVRTGAMLDEAHRAAADLLNAPSPRQTVFGLNMTTLTYALSRSLARTWGAGDRVVLTRTDHDANVTPWVQAAEDVGADVDWLDVQAPEYRLDPQALGRLLTDRTRLVAFGAASNATGTIHPVRELCAVARDCGALTFVDAVHYAPHRLTDVRQWGCDFAACSAYKFFGPHVGILYGKAEHLDGLFAYQLRPAPQDSPGRWMTGTQSHEGIAGTLAAIDYLASLGSGTSRRSRLADAFGRIAAYEQGLVARLLHGLAEIPGVRVYGITDPARLGHRVATVSITSDRAPAKELSRRLGTQGIQCYAGNYYALQLTERLGLEPHGMLRIGLMHYNTAEEVDRVLGALAREVGE